jgi:hypothetical protein
VELVDTSVLQQEGGAFSALIWRETSIVLLIAVTLTPGHRFGQVRRPLVVYISTQYAIVSH